MYMIMNKKTCTKCKVIFAATNEFFALHRGLKDGLHNCCKKCHAEQQKQRRLANPEKAKEIRIKSYNKTKEQYNAKRIWRYHNDPEYRAKRMDMDLKYRQSGARKKENRSEESWKKHLENSKKSKLKNPDKVLAYSREYSHKNRELLITFARENRVKLSDIYVRKVIQKTFRDEGIYVTLSEIPSDFVELKRKQLNIYRDVKNKKSKNRNNC